MWRVATYKDSRVGWPFFCKVHGITAPSLDSDAFFHADSESVEKNEKFVKNLTPERP